MAAFARPWGEHYRMGSVCSATLMMMISIFIIIIIVIIIIIIIIIIIETLSAALPPGCMSCMQKDTNKRR